MADRITRILVADDEDTIRRGFVEALGHGEGRYEIVTVGSGDEALARLRSEAFDLVFTDLKMPGTDGLTVVRKGREIRPETEFVLMTGYSSVESAVDAMKFGAVDYVQKPFTAAELVAHVEKAESLRSTRILRQEEEKGFERFTPSMRFQHIVLLVTFTLLTITGVPLLFPNTFKGVFFFEDSSLLRGILHRVAACGLIVLSLYHTLYLMVTDEGHVNLRQMLPKLPRDLFDAFGDFAFVLGLRKSRPPAGKYDWIEKFEYFAVVWGTLVMVGSGLVLWFTDAILRVFPLWVIDVAKVVHRYEAVLAIVSIAVWHMYTVHWRPGVFPMSRVWLDGRISRHDMIHHHALEYERLTGRKAETEEHDEAEVAR